MCFAKLSHKFCLTLRSSFFQDLSHAPQLGGRQIFVPPGSHLHQKREQFDASFCKAVNGFLFMAGVMRLDDDPLLDQPLQAISQNIRCNPFQRPGQELAKMPSVHEHDVADDEPTPLIAKYFDRPVHHAR